jgi:hypothetical protein
VPHGQLRFNYFTLLSLEKELLVIDVVLFPLRLMYFIVLTVFRVIGFFFGVSVKSARLMTGSFFILAIGVIVGIFLGRKLGGAGRSAGKARTGGTSV